MDGWISSRFDGIKENGFVKSIREVNMIVNIIGIPLVGKMEENVYKGNDLVLNISWYRDKK
jgi:hypothetical protein